MNSQTDIWSEWLLHGRHGGDSDTRQNIRILTERFSDRLLSGVDINKGMTLLDIGTGDGLVAFRAIERVGSSLNVIFTDISAPMLAYVKKIAAQNEIQNRCTFLKCSAERLTDIVDASVDVVVSRAALAYVCNKPAAFSECVRVLKPGGYISICEPIMRDDAFGVYMLKKLMDAAPPEEKDRLLELQWRIMAIQFPHTLEEISKNSTTNYTERDLIHLANNAGFMDVHMELHIDSQSAMKASWEAFLESSPHPLAPPVKKIIFEHFTEKERKYFHDNFRPIVESGTAKFTSRIIYLTGRKPVFE